MALLYCLPPAAQNPRGEKQRFAEDRVVTGGRESPHPPLAVVLLIGGDALGATVGSGCRQALLVGVESGARAGALRGAS